MIRKRSIFRNTVLAALLVACAGCEYHGLTCWNRLKILFNEWSLMLDEAGEIDASALADVRSRIASNVEQCRSGDFYRDFGAVGPGEFYITLFDLAVIADDVDLVAETHEKQLELERREEEFQLRDSPLLTAVYAEADDVVRWLLENGYGADEIDENGGNPLFYSGTRTEDGLRATRDLVANGADPNLEGPDGITPLRLAWRQGNMRKTQCLISLGAEIPEPLPELDGRLSSFVDPYDVDQVAAFLANSDRVIPDRIAEICSIEP